MLFFIFIFLFLSLRQTWGQENRLDSIQEAKACNYTFHGNPSDCRTYFQCNFGQRLLRECPPGLYWNQRFTTCDWPRNVHHGACTLPKENPSAGDLTDNIISPGADGSGMEDDTVVFEYTEACDAGTFKTNPKDCSTFYICDHESYVLLHCGPGLYWNSQITACDWPYNVNCVSSNTTPRPSPFLPSGTLSPPTSTSSPPTSSATPNLPAQPVITTPWKSGKKLVCYFTDWAWYRPLPSGKFLPSHIDPSLCTHIVYSFAVLNANDFIIQPADSWADLDNGFYDKVTSLKSTGTKVTLALGGWNDSAGNKYSVLVNDPTKRANFIEKTVAYLKKYNFDGLDLDWEYPKCWQNDCNQGPDSDRLAFGEFVKELRSALPIGFILSAAVSASKPVIDVGYDVPKLAKYLDWIGVMDYDFHGSWDRQTGHIAPLYYTPGDAKDYLNANYSINYWIKSGAPPDKLIMGIPLYGQTFTLSSSATHGLNAPSYSSGKAGTYTRQGGILAYYEICSQSWNIVQDTSGRMGPYGYNGNQWVSYDDIDMVTIKSRYIQSMGLGGGMVWALDMDDFTDLCQQGKYPLLTAIANTLRN